MEFLELCFQLLYGDVAQLVMDSNIIIQNSHSHIYLKGSGGAFLKWKAN